MNEQQKLAAQNRRRYKPGPVTRYSTKLPFRATIKAGELEYQVEVFRDAKGEVWLRGVL